jgi:UDP-glucose 4-epimerase
MSKCLVTGGAGFIGSNLVDALISDSHEVVVIDDLSTGRKEYINSKAKFYKADICDGKKINQIFSQEIRKKKIDFVFHLAAQMDVRISVANPELDNKINVLGGVNILENCRLFKIKKIFFTSTGGAIYGDTDIIPTSEKLCPAPLSPYGIHKLTFEKYLNYYHKIYGQKYLILRLANIYGPRQYRGGEAGVISIFIDNAVHYKKLIINGDGQQTRDYVYVGDVIAAFLKALKSDFIGAINISTAKETDLLEIINYIAKAMGKPVNKKHAPAKLGEQRRSCIDNKLAKKILDWQPKIKLVEGILKTINWSKRNSPTNLQIKYKSTNNK